MRSVHLGPTGIFCCAGLLLAACNAPSQPTEPGAALSVSAAPLLASAAPPAAPVQAPKPPPPFNVLLLTIDSLRADMPWTTYDRPIAPHMTALAKRSTVYTNAYSVSSTTAKSLPALLTGRYPSSLYRSGWFFAGYTKSVVFFPEILQDKGIRTMAGQAHMYFGRGKNLDQGFDEWELVPGLTFNAQTDKHVTSAKLTDLAIELIKKPENDGKQFFAWFHYMDPHDEYVKHEESPDFGKNNRDRYDSEVFYTDLHIKRLLDFCKTQPWWEQTAVIISADHGEAFGDHDMYKHAFEVWEVLTRVAMIIYVPGAKAQVIDQRRSHIDLAPTILDLMQVEGHRETFVGQSLLEEIYGREEPKTKDVLLDLPEDSHNPPRQSLLSGDYKITAHGKYNFFLYNLKEDPNETKNLAKKEPEQLKRMKKLFQERWGEIDQVRPFGGMKLRGGRKAMGPQSPPKKAPKAAETSNKQ